MALISQTRLWRASTTSDVVRYTGIVRSRDTAMLDIPAGQRPPVDQWGEFFLRYDLRGVLDIKARGVRDDASRHLIVTYDVWETDAARLAGGPPVFRNSHVFSRPKATTDLRQYLRGHIRDAVERAVLSNQLGDQRDLNLRRTQTDPTGFWDHADVVAIRNLILDIDTATTNPSSAPLRTNPETGE